MTAVRMTEGSIAGHLWRYALPLVLTNLFQLTYNAVDSAIVGRMISADALAAVSASSPVMNLLVLAISGLCVGTGVMISEAFGAGDEQGVRRALGTMLLCGVGVSVLVALGGIALMRPLLRLLAVPASISEQTGRYLSVALTGVPVVCCYNALASAAKSVGDARTPLRVLICSSVMNAALDVLAVAWLRLGVVSTAMTTVLSQLFSVVLLRALIWRRLPVLRMERGDWRLDRAMLGRMLSYGGTAALQQACQPIGKLMIQRAVNTLGVEAMACFGAVGRVDDYACLPAQSIAAASTTFLAQNRGAHQYGRLRSGFITAMLMELSWWPVIGLVTLLFRVPIMRVFIAQGDAASITEGCAYLAWMALFYLLPCMTNGCQGFFRGMGRMRVTLMGTLIQITLRVVFVYVLVPTMGLSGVAIASAIGWVCMLAAQAPLIVRALRDMKAAGVRS